MSSLRWIDSHCHFDFAAFGHNREQHWQWLQSLGVAGLIIPGVTRIQGQQLPLLCANKPWLYAQGLHPYFLDQHQQQDLNWLEQQLQRDPQVIAVGEVGLDKVLAKDEQQQKQQWHYFRAQIALAKQYKKPLILHVRAMHDQAASFLRQQQFSQGGIVHAFSGSQQQAKAWLDLGFKLGIGGAMTHPRASKLRATVAALPLQAWLLETDSPDMRSAFWREAVHSPAAIPCLAAILAALQKTTLAQVAQVQQQSLQQLWPEYCVTFRKIYTSATSDF